MPSKLPAILVRMKKPAHDMIAEIAQAENLTINEYVIRVLNKELQATGHPIIVPAKYEKRQKSLDKY